MPRCTQTGAGKTFTVIGNISNNESRGLAPRVFEYLYGKITDHENARGPDTVKYNCRCSFLEIYNETIADLLMPSASNLPIREDPEKGPYVDGLSEPPALNVDEMLAHLLKGAENRHTGETRLNRESSRSHSVFMCTVEKTVTSNGINKCFYARLNLVDLAGSERIASGAHGGSNATGEHFKEACHINKSLTALGRVTTELVKSQKNGGGGHVPYRDSKLTFLLQSSLGGNAKTLIIANVSPSAICAHETLSTLRFAKQTKHIRNDAKINWTLQGDRIAMQREIERLRMELASAHAGTNEPLLRANDELARQLKEHQDVVERLKQEKENISNKYQQKARELQHLDRRFAAISGADGRGAGLVLLEVVEKLEHIDAGSVQRLLDLAEVERELAIAKLHAEQEHRARVEKHLQATTIKGDLLSAQLAALIKEKSDLEESCSVLAENFAQAGARITEQKDQLASLQAELQVSRGNTELLQKDLSQERSSREQMERELKDTEAARHTAEEEAAHASSRAADLQARLDDKEAECGQQASRMEGLERQLEGALVEVQALQSRLAEAHEQLVQTQREGSASSDRLTVKLQEAEEQVQQLTSKLQEAETRAQATDRGLEETRQQLKQVNDTSLEHQQRLAELESQLGAKISEQEATLARLRDAESALAAEVELRIAAEAESVSTSNKLSGAREQLASNEARCVELSAALQRKEEEAARMGEQLCSREAALAEAGAQSALTQAEVARLAERIKLLESDAGEQASAHAAVTDSLRKAEQAVLQLEEAATALKAQLDASEHERTASEERALVLQRTVEDLQAIIRSLESQLQQAHAAKSKLETESSKKASEAQETASVLEARLAALEASKQSLAQQVAQEQATVASLRDSLAKNDASIKELREQLQEEEARANTARRQMAENALASQRQMAELEEQQLRDVHALKAELDKRSTELKVRDQEMVRTNFALKAEIDRLQASVEQAKRESVAAKAHNEQLAQSHQATIAGMNERLAKQVAHNKELMSKQDALKQQLDAAQREIESWKTKSERLDAAMADVTRLIRFARNPPESARSSLIMTRSDHLSPPNLGMLGSRVGFTIATAGQNPSMVESPAASPRKSQSRYSAASPAGSKAGSVGRFTGRLTIDEGDEYESSRRLPDIVSPGDQLPIPAMDD
ncbi:hypothetical protein GPECTOR_1g336 [Gonium pectorale]|uniref:Kinesin motor domain-containing protein n=1 Tax=Gonium pectorale TaxID=33097 RepID=A0A150H2I7_GONPE|nr:hypothetical protein GPECTOR_1g336 [Gonium pectorale]|eukprot:KXZ56379.1 hypothetical protein GPECTOR_1g336 [Gonium pectorale]